MFVQYTIKNFKSYQEQCTIDFTEARITEFVDTLYVSHKKELKILPISFLYGANGSGKSNLFHSILYLKNSIPGDLLPVPYYIGNPSCKEEPSEFDLTFRINEEEYNYVLKIVGSKVLEETLFKRTLPAANYDVLFDRDQEGVFLSALLTNVNVATLHDNQTMFAHLNRHGNHPLQDVLHYLLSLSVYDTSWQSTKYLKTVCENEVYKYHLIRHLNKAGVFLCDITTMGEDFLLTYENGIRLSYMEEAYGIRQLLTLFSYLELHLDCNVPLLIENLEHGLHPNVVSYIISLFTTHRDFQTKTQLLATTFDMANMSNRYLRRDEINLCELTPDGSILYSLAYYRKEQNEKVRKDETYFKQYLEGRYGALPVSRDVEFC